MPLLDDMDPSLNNAEEGQGGSQPSNNPIPPIVRSSVDQTVVTDECTSTRKDDNVRVPPQHETGTRPKQNRRPIAPDEEQAPLCIPPLTEADRFDPETFYKREARKREARATLNPVPSGADADAGISASVPNPPFTSYWDNVTDETIIPHFDRRIFEGVKEDTPPLIRRAKQIIDKYQIIFKKEREAAAAAKET